MVLGKMTRQKAKRIGNGEYFFTDCVIASPDSSGRGNLVVFLWRLLRHFVPRNDSIQKTNIREGKESK